MPISQEVIKEIVSKYDLQQISLASPGSHSCLDISEGGNREGFRTIAICQRDREEVYKVDYIKRRRGDEIVGCIDEVIVLDNWKDISQEWVLNKLKESNAIKIPNRASQVYFGYDIIHELPLPFFCNRWLLQAEERIEYKPEKNQDVLLEMADIPRPKKFNRPEEIDRPVLVKATEAIGPRPFRRKFAKADNTEQYYQECEKRTALGKTDEEKKIIEKNFKAATIQEFLEGHLVNLNFFRSVIYNETEFLGADTRWQFPDGEELVHIAISLKESLLKQARAIGKKLVDVCKEVYSPGIIGPFAAQCIAVEGEQLKVIDVCFRIPGAPDVAITPYGPYLFGTQMSYGRRIAREIKYAIRLDRLMDILT
jgi:5-formaminoimidazole-4-carboxamide-1-(beta)-D-ribofuranosyl 5'-monophosphate synthetase